MEKNYVLEEEEAAFIGALSILIYHGDKHTVRGDRQRLRPAILRALRRPGPEAEPHKHVQRKYMITTFSGSRWLFIASVLS